MDAVNSVVNQKSKYWDYEVIIYDNGTDDTPKLFKHNKNKKVHYFYNTINRGVNYSRNFCIKKSTGDLILFLDSDDIITKDCFSELEKLDKQNKLDYVNLFGTSEIKTGRKMFNIAEERKYSYNEWLEGKVLSGEFLSVVKKEVFKHDFFDESHFSFESFFWNRIIKKYGAFASPIVMRLYSFEQENRASKMTADPAYAAKKLTDYTAYLNEFGDDYLSFKLFKKYSEILVKLGVFNFLSANMREGRRWIFKSFKYHFSIFGILIFILSLFGHTILTKFYSIYLRFSV